ncbi:MAG: rod shape-determining protein MreC [Tistrella sp.]|uniref:Cell shape-determining protein MreC n=1 Tax=Tistrella mobilis TaxID=171437 RepID=A0A162KTR3_9PROT|nr:MULTISPECIES: rod shape-determining protein MreC [Tistrella]KYO52071.1 hypothetical protein AUP44_06210 [Tistrella mobilis]MAD37473.1 rod shape-determining protein MreC [Tistrella sp.]MBA74468.1 rod shape-determining protein MreC [Tistrella sp.]HAE50419.1 rod shape-determining protein MreC [Tistrella mobilis]
MKPLGYGRAVAQPLRQLAHRFAFGALVVGSVGLMIATRFDVVPVTDLRTAIADASTPALELFSRPVASLTGLTDRIGTLTDLAAENARLTEQNERLRHWEQVALRLAAENTALRRQLGVVPDPEQRFLSARILADTGGPFVRTLLISAGARDGMARDGIAVTSAGLVGRVIQVGETSSRLLLLSDLNSRVPVTVETPDGAAQRAILAGDNSPRPALAYLPPHVMPEVGARVVTSGEGGIFPPGLAVGRVISVEEGQIRVEPFVDWRRLDFVRILLGTELHPEGAPEVSPALPVAPAPARSQ